MASPPPHAPTPGDPALHPLAPTQYQALSDLVERGLSKDGILSLSKLGVAGAHKVLDILQELGREGMDGLVGPLEGVPEEALHIWLDMLQGKERGRSRTRQNPPRVPMDNPVATPTATAALATVYLRPPPPASLRRRSTSRASSESLSTRSTSLTHPSSRKRVKPNAKAPSTRKQLHCPECPKDMKNGFPNHFRTHLPDLFPGITITDVDLIGCGYCPCHDIGSGQGKVFQGDTALLDHVHEHHTQANSPNPLRLRWDFNLSFRNLISGEENIWRAFSLLAQEENKKIANKPHSENIPPRLSWIPSSTRDLLDDQPSTQDLLNEIQKLGGKIFKVSFTQLDEGDVFQVKDLVDRAYSAAHKWQPPKQAQSKDLPVNDRQSQGQKKQQQLGLSPSSFEDLLAFASMGAGASDESQYPSFDSPSPAIERRRQAQPPGPSLDNHRDAFAVPSIPSSNEGFSSTIDQQSRQEQPKHRLGNPPPDVVTPGAAPVEHSSIFSSMNTEPPYMPSEPDLWSLSGIFGENGISEKDLYNNE